MIQQYIYNIYIWWCTVTHHAVYNNINALQLVKNSEYNSQSLKILKNINDGWYSIICKSDSIQLLNYNIYRYYILYFPYIQNLFTLYLFITKNFYNFIHFYLYMDCFNFIYVYI